MAPADLLNDADRATKQQLFKTGGATVRPCHRVRARRGADPFSQTHNPFENIFVRDEDLEVAMQDPVTEPSDTILKLSAMLPY